jgi:uncharacterized protein with PIN domain
MRRLKKTQRGLRQEKPGRVARSMVQCRQCGLDILKVDAAEETIRSPKYKKTVYLCMTCVRASWES